MLHRQNGRRYQHDHLFAVAYGLEGGANGDFGFAKTHIAANQAVHRVRLFHVVLDVVGGLGLVGRVFVNKGRFQFGLHEIVVTKSEARGLAPLGIEGNQLFGDVLQLLLDAAFLGVPLARTELVHLRWRAFPACVFGNFVQVVDAHVQQVVVAVHQPHGFLLLAVDVALFHARKTPDAVVHVGHEVAGLQRFQLFERDGLGFVKLDFELVLVVARENLVVGIAG